MTIHNVQSSVASQVTLNSISDTGAGSVTAPGEGGARPSLLPDPMTVVLGGDPAAEIAEIAIKQGQEENDVNTKAAETQDSVADTAAAAEVSTMHAEASELRAGAWSSGLLQIGAGGASIGAAGMSNPSSAGMLKGSADALNGAATIAGGVSKGNATDLEASATASKALSDAAVRAGGVDRDTQKAAQAFVQSAIDFVREYESTKAQAQAAAVHGA